MLKKGKLIQRDTEKWKIKFIEKVDSLTHLTSKMALTLASVFKFELKIKKKK